LFFSKNILSTSTLKEYCYNEIKSHLDNENFDVLSEGIFEWKVKNWNQILNDEFSPKFTICNHEW